MLRNPLLTSQADSLIMRAARMAAEAHHGQRRSDGEPYINHPMRVAGTVTLVESPSVALVAAGWLHDVVEDTDVPLETIFHVFGEEVALLVRRMTNVFTKDAYPALNRQERKQAELERLVGYAEYEIHTLKLADRYDNTHKVLSRGRKFAQKYMRETVALAEALTSGDTQLRHLLLDRSRRLEKEL